MSRSTKWCLIGVLVALLSLGACIAPRSINISSIEKFENTNAWVVKNEFHIAYTVVYSEAFSTQLEQTMRVAHEELGIDTLVIHLDNGGGSGFIMFDVINGIERLKKDLGIKVVTIARGIVASAAIPIFLVGDTRITYEDTSFMIHPISGWNHPMVPDCDKKLIIWFTTEYCRYVAERTNGGMSFAQCWDIMAPAVGGQSEHAYWFFVDEALARGFATEVR